MPPTATASTPFTLGRKDVGLLPCPLGLTTNVRTAAMPGVKLSNLDLGGSLRSLATPQALPNVLG